MKTKVGSPNPSSLWLLLILFAIFVTLGVIYQYALLNGKVRLGITPQPQKSTPAIKVEVEPNTSFEQASQLKPGYETQGTLASGKDIDMYWFSIDRPSTINIASKNLPKEYSFTLYDSNRIQIATSNRIGFTEGSSILTLQTPGKYYIKVATNYLEPANLPYTITLTIRPFFE